MENKKYTLSDASLADQEAFKKELNDLLNKLSLHMSLIITKEGIAIKSDDGNIISGFIDRPTLIIQHKEEKVEEGIISPIQADDLSTPA